MNTLDQITLLIYSLGEIQGRRKIQKIVYLLQEFGVEFGVRYRFSNFGPYSEELEEDIKSYFAQGILTTRNGQEGSSSSGYILNVQYKISRQNNKHCWWIDIAQDLNQLPSKTLETIGILWYLEKKSNIPFDSPGWENDITNVYPNSDENIKESAVYLNKIKTKYLKKSACRFNKLNFTPDNS